MRQGGTVRVSRRGLLATLGGGLASLALPGLARGARAHEHGGHAPAEIRAPDGQHATRALLFPPPAEPAEEGRVREFELVATEVPVEVAAGVVYEAWTYNGSVPGPVIRATEGDLVRVRFRNEGARSHNAHFHGIHPTTMDGIEPIPPGGETVYEFAARPAGLHLYHCHTPPLASHVARGLYGVFIVDPKTPRPDADELVLVLSGFDLDGDERNEIYAINGRAFVYGRYPIYVEQARPLRLYVANMTEYDPVVTFHLHAGMFRCLRTGTGVVPEYTDVVTLAQGERAILEVEFANDGLFMFHAHQHRLAERGMLGWFDVVAPGGTPSSAGGDKAATKY